MIEIENLKLNCFCVLERGLMIVLFIIKFCIIKVRIKEKVEIVEIIFMNYVILSYKLEF